MDIIIIVIVIVIVIITKLYLIYVTACQKLQVRKQLKFLINKNNSKKCKGK